MESPRLVHIPFSNSRRLTARTHLFAYRGQAFKLVQDARGKHADNLLCIVQDDAEQERAFSIAAEFFSALAWRNSSRVAFGVPLWGKPAPASLNAARASMFTFPLITPGGDVGGYHISSIPHVQTDQQRLALALFREAGASNNEYLRFLFLWQILAIGAEPIGVANSLWRRSRDALLRHDHVGAIERLPLRGKSIGNYFDDDCRNAIGHITRPPGETTLDFDSQEDRKRMSLSARAVRAFAVLFIEERLNLTGELHLYRAKRGAIPEYFEAGSAESIDWQYVHPARL
jgi:hypothetical protein